MNEELSMSAVGKNQKTSGDAPGGKLVPGGLCLLTVELNLPNGRWLTLGVWNSYWVCSFCMAGSLTPPIRPDNSSAQPEAPTKNTHP